MVKISRCYDSHSHLLATGQVVSMMDLTKITSPTQISNIKIEQQFYRGEWLLGFGWDQHNFFEKKFPERNDLDKIFPNTPVAFSRADGHAVWVNTRALEVCGLEPEQKITNQPQGGYIDLNELHQPTGIFIDRAMEKVFKFIPQDSFEQKKKDLQQACHYYNRQGFTHLRDMSGDGDQWQALIELDKQNMLTLYVEENFVFEKESEIDLAFQLALESKKNATKHLRGLGIKFYMDGALGSEGAWLSQNYPGTNHCGLQIWHSKQIYEWIKKAWKQELEVSVHAIGNKASESLASIAREVWQTGIRGKLNIEHAEILSQTTFNILQGMNVHFHMQPCHWLTDSKWLKNKVGTLFQDCFQWKKVEDHGHKLSWGSDSPIEKPSLAATDYALKDSSRMGIPSPDSGVWCNHQHPDISWGPNCQSDFAEDWSLQKLVFDNIEF